MAPQLAYIRDQIRGVLEYPNLGQKDSVLITLHGHGVQYDEVDSSGKKTPKFYFCPADATVSGLQTANDITERNRLLPLDELYRDLESCKAATKLLIVDACRNDPTAPGVFRESLASSTLPKLPPPEGGTAASLSCKPIPAGSFLMGSPESEEKRNDDEGPQHRVTISKPFYAGKYEVTIGQVLQWLNAPGVRIDDAWIDTDNSNCPVRESGNRWEINSSTKFGSSESQPMQNISWHGAVAFCEWLSRQDSDFTYRLPTEAEWE